MPRGGRGRRGRARPGRGRDARAAGEVRDPADAAVADLDAFADGRIDAEEWFARVLARHGEARRL